METINTKDTVKRQFGLNRTMQYGNPGASDADEKEAYSLNRTMQYGNEKNKEKKTDISDGLNRTMQYGNKDGQKICVKERKV